MQSRSRYESRLVVDPQILDAIEGVGKDNSLRLNQCIVSLRDRSADLVAHSDLKYWPIFLHPFSCYAGMVLTQLQ